MNYYDLLKSYIQRSGLSLSEISNALKEFDYQVSKGYISQLQNGKTDAPATAELNRALAKVTGGDIEELLTAALIEKAPPEIREKFEKLNKLKKLQTEYTQSLQGITIKEVSANYIADGLTKVPLLGFIAAGQPMDRIEYIQDAEYVHSSIVRGYDAFALEVKGDSMIGDNITEGDIVICIVVKEVSQTDIAVVAVENENATIKRVKCQDDICMLIPSNPKMTPTIVASNKIEILGKVVEVRRRFK